MRRLNVRGNDGVTLVELLFTVGIVSMLTLFLMDVMGKPQQTLNSALERVSSSQTISVEMLMIKKQLAQAGILKTGLMRCNGVDVDAMKNYSVPEDVRVFRNNAATEGQSFTIPFASASELAGKVENSPDTVLIENTASFPTGSIVALTHLRSSASGGIFVVTKVVADRSLALKQLWSREKATESPRMPDWGCDFLGAKSFEALRDMSDGVKLFGQTPAVFRIDRLQFAKYTNFSKSLVANILEKLEVSDTGVTPVTWQTVVVPSWFSLFEVTFKWFSDNPEMASDPNPEYQALANRLGEMQVNFTIRVREAYDSPDRRVARASQPYGKVERELNGQTKFEFRSGSSINFAPNLLASAPQSSVASCDVIVKPFVPAADMDSGAGGFNVSPPLDPLQLYDVDATAKDQPGGAMVSVTFDARGSTRTPRCWLKDKVVPGTALDNTIFTFAGALPNQFRAPANAAEQDFLAENTMGSLRILPDDSSATKRHYLCELPPGTRVAGSLTAVNSYVDNNNKQHSDVEVTPCSGGTDVPNYPKIGWDDTTPYQCRKTELAPVGPFVLRRYDALDLREPRVFDTVLKPTSCLFERALGTVVDACDKGAAGDKLLEVNFGPAFPISIYSSAFRTADTQWVVNGERAYVKAICQP